MKKYKIQSFTIFLAATVVSNLSAAVLLDPTRIFGDDAIDPSGSATATAATGATAQSTLESDLSFGAVQSFTGFVAGQNIISFADTSIPDVRLTLTGNFSTDSGATFDSSGYATSGSSAVRLKFPTAGTTLSQLTYTIEFGNYDSGTVNFTPGTVVDKAGFTLANLYTNYSATADFYNSTGGLLKSITATGGGSTSTFSATDYYFGYASDGSQINGIAKIVLNVVTELPTTNTMGFDDLGFSSAIIPEPASMGMLLGMCAIVVAWTGRGRRREG